MESETSGYAGFNKYVSMGSSLFSAQENTTTEELTIDFSNFKNKGAVIGADENFGFNSPSIFNSNISVVTFKNNYASDPLKEGFWYFSWTLNLTALFPHFGTNSEQLTLNMEFPFAKYIDISGKNATVSDYVRKDGTNVKEHVIMHVLQTDNIAQWASKFGLDESQVLNDL